MDPITVDIQLTPEDAVLARRLDRSRRTWVGRHGTWLFVLVLAAHFSWLAGLFFSVGEYFWVPAFFAAWAMNVVIIGYRVWTRMIARRAYWSDANLQRPFRLEVSDFGVQSSGLAPPGTQRWGEVKRWAQGELHYLIYAPGGAYHVVPKRFMSDTAALAEVLREKVGPPV